MLRSMFISLSHVRWAQDAITHAPLARNVARRFIAGQELAEAIDAIRTLNADGVNVERGRRERHARLSWRIGTRTRSG